MKNQNLFFLLGTIACLLCSCHQQEPKYNSQYDSIIVAYYPYLFETSVAITCKDMERNMQKSNNSIVNYISVEDYHHFCDILNNRKHAESPCEARIFIQMDTVKICLGDFMTCACDIEDIGLNITLEEIYWIKSIIGYYNWFKDDDLIYDAGIQQFGVPHNYHYIEREIVHSTEDGKFKLYDPKIKKIILKVNDSEKSGTDL